MRIVLSGYGTMGKILTEEISNNTDFNLVGVVDKYHSIGVKSFSELNVIPDIIIDFSHPSNLDEMLQYAKTNTIPLLIATTGLTSSDMDMIIDCSDTIPILQTGNTSFGINLVSSMLEEMAQFLDGFDIEIIEKHHNKKVDAPSGTAKMLVDAVKSEESIVKFGRLGNDKRKIEDITVHSIRGGSIVGEHTVLFAGNDEVIEVKHQAMSKKVFATGAIKAASFLVKQENGLYNMKDVFRGELWKQER